MSFSCVSHPNIALVKYWGKSDDTEVTPLHGSLSLTLDFGSTTTIASFSDSDSFSLNAVPAEITPRLQSALSFFHSRSPRSFSLQSTNTFPTAAGFASSASGAAAFVGALAALTGDTEAPIPYWQERNVDLGILMRRVSGSGCRSIFGGFVEWMPGDSATSVARQVFDENYWPEIRVLSIDFQSQPKQISSTVGMKLTAETVPWIKWRAVEVVPKRIELAKTFLTERDFDGISEIIMRDSNELHANCAAAFPPVHYLNDRSRQLIAAVHLLNEREGRIVAAYTFDAGPNPFVFVREADLELVKGFLTQSCAIKEDAVRVARGAPGIQIRKVV
jgi:diphosphomevalonate decarboxylase